MSPSRPAAAATPPPAATPRRRRAARRAEGLQKAFLAFDKAFPWVKTYSAWNEINHKSQPTFKSPGKAAGYYNVLRKYTRKKKIRVMAADMLDTRNFSRYLSSFKRKAKGSPKLSGLHNYGDVNRRRTTYTKRMLRSVPGEVWLTETGGIVKLLPSFKRSTSRAKARTRGMFKLVNRLRHLAPWHALEDHAAVRVLVLRREPTARFDAGLVNPDGSPARRSACSRRTRAGTARRIGDLGARASARACEDPPSWTSA